MIKKLTRKQKITKIINDLIWSSKYIFRFSTVIDYHTNNMINCDGYCDDILKEIVLKNNYDFINTLAHELAHVDQFKKHGDSDCTGQNKELTKEHYRFTNGWLKDLDLLGIVSELKQLNPNFI